MGDSFKIADFKILILSILLLANICHCEPAQEILEVNTEACTECASCNSTCACCHPGGCPCQPFQPEIPKYIPPPRPVYNVTETPQTYEVPAHPSLQIPEPGRPAPIPELNYTVPEPPEVTIPKAKIWEKPEIPEFTPKPIPGYEVPVAPEREYPGAPEIKPIEIPERVYHQPVPEYEVPKVPEFDVPEVTVYEKPLAPEHAKYEVKGMEKVVFPEPLSHEVEVERVEVPEREFTHKVTVYEQPAAREREVVRRAVYKMPEIPERPCILPTPCSCSCCCECVEEEEEEVVVVEVKEEEPVAVVVEEPVIVVEEEPVVVVEEKSVAQRSRRIGRGQRPGSAGESTDVDIIVDDGPVYQYVTLINKGNNIGRRGGCESSKPCNKAACANGPACKCAAKQKPAATGISKIFEFFDYRI